jgi:hypothetical protein
MPHYRFALDHWAGARDVERARSRWLAIAFRMGWPGRGDLLQNWWAGQIRRDRRGRDEDRALGPGARAGRRCSTPRSCASAAGTSRSSSAELEALDLAVSLGSETPWLADALWMAAQWYENQGAPSSRRTGPGRSDRTTRRRSRSTKRIVAEFRRAARSGATRPKLPCSASSPVDLSLGVGQAFLPARRSPTSSPGGT